MIDKEKTNKECGKNLKKEGRKPKNKKEKEKRNKEQEREIEMNRSRKIKKL